MIKVLFLTKDFKHFSTRYRVSQYIDFFHANHVDCKVSRFPHSIREWIKLLRISLKRQVLFVQKKKFRLPAIILFRKIVGLKIIYDIDDSVMFSSSSKNYSSRRLLRFKRMVQNCDVVIVGNSFLKQVTSRFTNHVKLIPVGVDVKNIVPKANTKLNRRKITVGWSGGPTSLPHLESFLPTLEKLYANNPSFQLKIVSRKFIENSMIPTVKQYWTEDTYVEQLCTFDVAISPLTDDNWAKGKSASKLLYYMAAGLPTVSSRLGAHLDIIKDGTNGFLASDEAEFIHKLTLLMEDPELRRIMGLAARRWIEKYYSVETIGERILHVIKEVVLT